MTCQTRRLLLLLGYLSVLPHCLPPPTLDLIAAACRVLCLTLVDLDFSRSQAPIARAPAVLVLLPASAAANLTDHHTLLVVTDTASLSTCYSAPLPRSTTPLRPVLCCAALPLCPKLARCPPTPCPPDRPAPPYPASGAQEHEGHSLSHARAPSRWSLSSCYTLPSSTTPGHVDHHNSLWTLPALHTAHLSGSS